MIKKGEKGHKEICFFLERNVIFFKRFFTFSSFSLLFSFFVLAQDPTPIDYDIDNDNLIDVSNLEQLDAIRYDLDGNGMVILSDMTAYRNAFPNPASQMGCPSTCLGYELKNDLNFKDLFSYASRLVYDPWVNRSGSGFLPLGHREGENLVPSSTSPTSVFSISLEDFPSMSTTPTVASVSTPSLPGHLCSSETSNSFTAIFEGNGHKISHLFINRHSLSAGLFQCIGENSKVRNLGLEFVDIVGASQTGALTGYNTGIISNSYILGGFVKAYGDNVGGLVGSNEDGVISNSYSTANVTGLTSSESANVGGLVGFNKGQVLNSFSSAEVKGYTAVGGLIGKDASVDSNIVTKVFYNYSLSRVTAETMDFDALIGLGGTGINLFRYDSVSQSFIRINNFYVVSNSFWSTDNTGISVTSLRGGKGFTNLELQQESIGNQLGSLFFEWSTDNWNFGSTTQYPSPKYNQVRATRQTPQPSGSSSVMRLVRIGEDLEACDSDSSNSEKPDCQTLLPADRGPFLGSLSVSGTNLSSIFIPEITNYELNVPNSLTDVTVSLRGESSLSNVKFNGSSLSSSTDIFSSSLSLEQGDNFAFIDIAGSLHKRTYTVKVIRFPVPKLSSITLSNVTLSPSFTPDQLFYSATVNNNVESVRLTLVVSGTEVINIGENILKSGEESPPISLK